MTTYNANTDFASNLAYMARAIWTVIYASMRSRPLFGQLWPRTRRQ